MSAQVIALCNQKGGTAKTSGTVSLGVGIADRGYRVLCIDLDPQASLSASLGYTENYGFDATVNSILDKFMEDREILPGEGILHHAEGIDVLPSDIGLASTEVSMFNAMSRESLLRQYISIVRSDYDYILIDCQPSLGILTINALAAADRVIIPVQPEFLPVKGLQQLMKTINKVHRTINPNLQVSGIVLTLVNSRTNLAQSVSRTLRQEYGSSIHVFRSEIPYSVRAKEASSSGCSIFSYDPNGKVAEAYRNLTEEVLTNERQKEQRLSPGIAR